MKDLKNKFKDLGSLYEELEEQLSDVHFMNLKDLKKYKRRADRRNYKYKNIPNSQKNFNYNYNNLNDYYYNLYKKLTNKKQKVTENNDEEKVKNKKLYNIDNKISLKFSNTELDKSGVSFSNSQLQDKQDTSNISKDTINGKLKNKRPKKINRYDNQRYPNQNNFIPSGIKIPKKFDNNNNNNNNNNDNNNNDNNNNDNNNNSNNDNNKNANDIIKQGKLYKQKIIIKVYVD